jgi:hypothetical protein
MTQMRYVVLSICALGAGLTSVQSQAQSLEERLRACSTKQTQDEKLECYESLTTEPKAAPAPVPAPVPAPTPTPAPKPVPAPTRAAEPPASVDSEFGLQGEHLRRKRASEPKAASSEPVKLTAHISGVTRRPGGMFGFELDNGQVWAQTQKMQAPPPDPGEQVTITSGALGSFFLTFESGLTSRVMRVR